MRAGNRCRMVGEHHHCSECLSMRVGDGVRSGSRARMRVYLACCPSSSVEVYGGERVTVSTRACEPPPCFRFSPGGNRSSPPCGFGFLPRNLYRPRRRGGLFGPTPRLVLRRQGASGISSASGSVVYAGVLECDSIRRSGSGFSPGIRCAFTLCNAVCAAALGAG